MSTATIEQSVKDLVAATAAAEAKARREHWAALLELLRSGGGAASDAKAALKHLEAVGKSAKDLPALAAVVAEHARHTAASTAADDPALTADIEAAGKALIDYQAETERIKRERIAEQDRLWITLDKLNRQRSGGHAARRKLAEIERGNWELFGGAEPQDESQTHRLIEGVARMEPFMPTQPQQSGPRVRATMGVGGYKLDVVAKS